MIKSKGIVTIVKRDAITGEVIDTFTQNNVVTYTKLQADVQDSGITAAARLFVSTRPRIAGVPVSGHFNSQQSVRADDISGTPRFEFTPKTVTDAAFWTVTGRVSPPVSGTRNLTGAFLSSTSGANPSTSSTTAYVVFTTPCPQADTEVLDLFYRVVLDDAIVPGPNVFDWVHEDYNQYWWFSDITPTNGGGVDNYPVSITWLWSPNVGPNRTLDGISENDQSTTVSNDVVDMVKTLSTSFDLADNPGAMLGAAQLGRDIGGPMSVIKLLRPGDTPIQSVFGKDANSVIPFIDSLNAASGSGTLTPEGSSWSNPDLPHHYRVNITNTGDIGTAEYQIQRRRTVGYLGNNWRSSFARLVSCRAQYGFSQTSAGAESENPTKGTEGLQHGQSTLDSANVGFAQFLSTGYSEYGLYPYLGTDSDAFEFITMDSTGLTVVDFAKDTYFNIDADSAIALPVTGVKQVSHESDGTIWVACSDTGLYRVERSSIGGPVSSVTKMTVSGVTDTNAYCVRVSPRNDDIWAMFEGGLAQSTDGGSSWTVYNEASDPQFLVTGYTGTGGTAWDLFTSIHIDPVSTEDRLVIGTPITPSTSGRGRITFWSRAGSSPTSDALISNNNASGEAIGNYLTGARFGHFSTDGRFYAKDSSKGTALAIFEWMNATGTSLTANTPSTDHGMVVVKNQSGDDLIVGVETVGGEEHHVARNFSQLGTTSFELDLGGYPPVVDDRGFTSLLSIESPVTYLGKGIYLCYSDQGVDNNASNSFRRSVQYMLNMFGGSAEPLAGDFQFDVWESYGWDGSSWVLGNPNSRLTHATSEALLDGLTLSFSDDAPSPSFADTDYYLFGVYDGVMKDDATSFDYESFVPFSQTESGTTFTPSTVPAVDTGSVVGESISWIHGDKLASEPGMIGPMVFSSSSTAQSMQVLEGDFEVSFRADLFDDSGNSTANAFGLSIIDEVTTLNTNATPLQISHQHSIFFKDDDLTDQSNDRTLIGESGSLVDTTVAPFDRDNVYTIRRTGTLIEYLNDGVVFYTSSNVSSGNKIVKYFSNNSFGTITEAVVNYTANRRLVSIGNGTTTGSADPNFRKVPISIADSQILVNLDAVPAVVLTDPYAIPVAGECVILPNGQVRFNSADAGKSITGSWITTLKLNLQ